MLGFGATLADIRKAHSLSQSDLADRAQVSQASVSRWESTDEYPTDIKVLRRLAKALGEPLIRLLPEKFVREINGSQGDQFRAFCPNPLCTKNELTKAADNRAWVSWKSGQMYPAKRFTEINFCSSCGTDLVKACPECERRIGPEGGKFCITCGAPFTTRPTTEEWSSIRTQLGLPEPAPKPPPPAQTLKEDDIPF